MYCVVCAGQAVLSKCVANYKKLSERDISISVDTQNWLRADVYVTCSSSCRLLVVVVVVVVVVVFVVTCYVWSTKSLNTGNGVVGEKRRQSKKLPFSNR